MKIVGKFKYSKNKAIEIIWLWGSSAPLSSSTFKTAEAVNNLPSLHLIHFLQRLRFSRFHSVSSPFIAISICPLFWLFPHLYLTIFIDLFDLYSGRCLANHSLTALMSLKAAMLCLPDVYRKDIVSSYGRLLWCLVSCQADAKAPHSHFYGFKGLTFGS